MKSILIIGVVPPPVGGVSIHIKRLLEYMEDRGCNYLFYDYKKKSKLDGLKLLFKSKIIHTNFGNKHARFISTILCRVLGKKVILTFHSKYDFRDFYDRCSLKLSSHSFILNKFTYDNASKVTKPEKLELISAFIPPVLEERDLTEELKKDIHCFIAGRRVVGCTNAHSYVIDENGKDLYGIDFLLEIFKDLPDAGLIISDPSGRLKEKYASYIDSGYAYFITEPHSFMNILKISDVFLRTTTRDGDSLSVKEALSLNKKVIVSDAVDRPAGCLIYKTGDRMSFLECLKTERASTPAEIENGAIAIVELYKKMAQ